MSCSINNFGSIGPIPVRHDSRPGTIEVSGGPRICYMSSHHKIYQFTSVPSSHRRGASCFFHCFPKDFLTSRFSLSFTLFSSFPCELQGRRTVIWEVACHLGNCTSCVSDSMDAFAQHVYNKVPLLMSETQQGWCSGIRRGNWKCSSLRV